MSARNGQKISAKRNIISLASNLKEAKQLERISEQAFKVKHQTRHKRLNFLAAFAAKTRRDEGQNGFFDSNQSFYTFWPFPGGRNYSRWVIWAKLQKWCHSFWFSGANSRWDSCLFVLACEVFDFAFFYFSSPCYPLSSHWSFISVKPGFQWLELNSQVSSTTDHP